MNKVGTWVIFNTIALSICYYLYSVGVVATAFTNDALYINEAILTIFGLGMVGSIVRWKYTTWCADTLVGLGFMGTLFGVWTAFGNIRTENISDVQSVIPILVGLISGIGVAIWTTVLGLFFYTWLTINMEIFDEEK